MPGAVKDLPAVSRWSIAYLGSTEPDLRVRLKAADVASGVTSECTLREYCEMIQRQSGAEGLDLAEPDPLPYLHDYPLFTLIPALRRDAEPFPVEFFPSFFRAHWWNFAQFFIGAAGARTSFHFDTLLTHNLFFQIRGRKRFVVVPAEDAELCYTHSWRWSPVDADQPDYQRYPLFRRARRFECTLNGGDLLYLPPGTLHQVTSLTDSVSFNIDWHDRRSALQGIIAPRQGMPLRNLQYNLAFALGIWAGVPDVLLMPMLKSYYYYIS